MLNYVNVITLRILIRNSTRRNYSIYLYTHTHGHACIHTLTYARMDTLTWTCRLSAYVFTDKYLYLHIFISGDIYTYVCIWIFTISNLFVRRPFRFDIFQYYNCSNNNHSDIAVYSRSLNFSGCSSIFFDLLGFLPVCQRVWMFDRLPAWFTVSLSQFFSLFLIIYSSRATLCIYLSSTCEVIQYKTLIYFLLNHLYHLCFCWKCLIKWRPLLRCMTL